jgi:hypothetical protein
MRRLDNSSPGVSKNQSLRLALCFFRGGIGIAGLGNGCSARQGYLELGPKASDCVENPDREHLATLGVASGQTVGRFAAR